MLAAELRQCRSNNQNRSVLSSFECWWCTVDWSEYTAYCLPCLFVLWCTFLSNEFKVVFHKERHNFMQELSEPYLNPSTNLWTLVWRRSYVHVIGSKIEGLFEVLYNITHLFFQLSPISPLLGRMFFFYLRHQLRFLHTKLLLSIGWIIAQDGWIQRSPSHTKNA
jgi:hypothetical protein